MVGDSWRHPDRNRRAPEAHARGRSPPNTILTSSLVVGGCAVERHDRNRNSQCRLSEMLSAVSAKARGPGSGAVMMRLIVGRTGLPSVCLCATVRDAGGHPTFYTETQTRESGTLKRPIGSRSSRIAFVPNTS
jgi:hypothetical protein